MKPVRIELPPNLPLVALQGFLREHNLQLQLIGGNATFRDYRAQPARQGEKNASA